MMYREDKILLVKNKLITFQKLLQKIIKLLTNYYQTIIKL